MNRNHFQDAAKIDYRIYLPKRFREFIETNFYERVAEQSKLENIKHDPTFLADPTRHIALYTDHGVVHVRDVANQVLDVLKKVNGQLIPLRDYSGLEFMRAYALHLVYFHDIGMHDLTEFGRFMHPEFAAQYLFQDAFQEQFESLWRENSGNIPWQLLTLYQSFYSEKEIKRIFRELLTLSVGHSKSKVPIELVNHPEQLADHMATILATPLPQLYYSQKRAKLKSQLAKIEDEETKKAIKIANNITQLERDRPTYEAGILHYDLSSFYNSYDAEAFQWLKHPKTPEQKRFILNVLDSLRCLRAADALRQRGTVLRTSAGYEVFVDRKSANAIFALRSADNKELYLLEGKKPLNAGEANVASSELDGRGNLRLAFHRGHFKNTKIVKKGALNAAVVIDDIQADTIQSFKRDLEFDEDLFPPPLKSFEDIRILIEEAEDNEDFAKLVRGCLEQLNPEAGKRAKIRVSLQGADLLEVKRYLNGIDFLEMYADKERINKMIERISAAGGHLIDTGSKKLFKEVKIITVEKGEQVIRSGLPSGFVYIPLDDGLQVFPMGGYQSKLAPPWVPLGNTGVIRGSVRNANVIADRSLKLIMIPKNVYLNHWYLPYTAKSLAKVWKSKY